MNTIRNFVRSREGYAITGALVGSGIGVAIVGGIQQGPTGTIGGLAVAAAAGILRGGVATVDHFKREKRS